MSPQTSRVVSVYAVVVVLGAAFGAAQGPRTPVGLVVGAITGGLIGVILTAFEIQMRDRYARELRRFKPYKVAIFRFLFYLAAFYFVPSAVASMAHLFVPEIATGELIGDRHLVLYFLFSLAVNLFMAVRRMLGARYLWAMAVGRYHRPREEERIVAFMDLHGSTQLAERLGAQRYHDFLNDVFFDLVEPILQSGGDVYQYVGDEIVVTWLAERGVRDADCVKYFFAVEDKLAQHRDLYLERYGAVPSLRGALHIGPLMVGEIGDLKRQIVMIGDTMNTASRIEGACRQFGRDYVASALVLDRLAELPAGITKERLGLVHLAGKTGEMELFALVRG